MIRKKTGLIWLFLLGLAMVGAGPASAQVPSETDVQRWVDRYEDPARNEWQGGTFILQLLSIEPGDQVVDLGVGTGYFVRFLTGYVGDKGHVYGVDINPAFLAHIESRTDILHMERLSTILADVDDPKLPPGEIDVILILNTWHHIEDRVAYARKLREAMSPTGRVLVVDWRQEPLPIGPPPGEKLTRETVIKEFQEAGWKLATDSSLLKYHYMLNFYPERP